MRREGYNTTPVISVFFLGGGGGWHTFSFLRKCLFQHINCTLCNQSISIKQKLNRHSDQQYMIDINSGDLFSLKKWSFVYTVHQSLIMV